MDFKTFLKEAKTKKPKAAPIGADKRKATQKDVLQFLVDLDEKAKKGIFGRASKALANRSAFGGQSGHFMDHNMKDDKLKDMKSSLNSIHVMIPDNKKSHLDKHLMGQIGDFKVVNVDKKPSKYSAVLKNIKTNAHSQMDFTFHKYENDEPSHFAKWSNASHMTDRGYKLPQSARHVLMSSLVAAKGFGPGYVKNGKKYQHHDNVEKHSFSMREGLRTKHVPISNATHMGLPVYRRADPNDPIQDVPKILGALVGKKPKVGEVKDSEHFHGVAKFAASNLTAGEKRNVAKKFQSLLADKKFHKDPTKDSYQRKLISNHFSTHFGQYMVRGDTLDRIKKLRKQDI